MKVPFVKLYHEKFSLLLSVFCYPTIKVSWVSSIGYQICVPFIGGYYFYFITVNKKFVFDYIN